MKLYIYIGILWLAVLTAQAQEPIPTSPQRVTDGVLEPDTTVVERVYGPQSRIFRDSIPISRVTALSIVLPGFSQLYNRDAWKIPILYGGVGGLTYLGIEANKKFQVQKRQYNFLMDEYYAMTASPAKDRYLTGTIDPIRTQMIKYDTQRTLYFAGAAATYLYFLVDGVVNFPNETTRVKKATTLALMFPGAGQIYNKSYWKAPIVTGAFVTMGFLVDWNNRRYQRMRTAYNNPDNNEFTNDPRYNTWLTRDDIKKRRDVFRRDRDMFILLTGAVYLLSVVEAHVDAYMKDFDVSDDLSMHVEPTLIDLNGYLAGMNAPAYPGFGMALKVNF